MFDPIKIAFPYAKAVFQIAKEKSSFNLWQFFLRFITIVVEEQSVKLFLKNPTVSPPYKVALLKTIYDNKFNDIFIDNFITLVASKKRLLYLPYIFSLFEKSLFFERKEVRVAVTTTSSDLKELRANIIFYLRKVFGHNVHITSECVDKEIIGGVLITTTDNKMIDATFSGILKRLKQSFEMF